MTARYPCPVSAHRRLNGFVSAAIALAAASLPAPVLANNYGESLGWQFKTSLDRAYQASVLDMIEKRRAGFYAAPVYTTNVARQFNCSVAAAATGNSNGQSALANSPSVTGAVATATGNHDATTVDGGRPRLGNQQLNTGTIAAGVNGGTDTVVDGVATQALNAVQTNGGVQSASVAGSQACTFPVLN